MATLKELGLYEPGLYESDTVEEGGEASTAILSLASPPSRTTRTMYGSSVALTTPTVPSRTFPQLIVSLHHWLGPRFFTNEPIPDSLAASSFQIHVLDMQVEPMTLATVPAMSHLIGAIGASERPELTITFQNRSRLFSELLEQIVLSMPAGLFLYWSPAKYGWAYQGQVTRVRLRKSACAITISEL